MSEEESAPTPRRRGRPAGAGTRTATTRRRRVGGVELVETLNAMVDQLINENRRLKRELSRLSSGAPAEADGTSEKTLRTLHRKVELAVTAAPTRRRGASTASATPRRRGPRRQSSPETSV